WRNEIADSFTKTGVRLRFFVVMSGGCLLGMFRQVYFEFTQNLKQARPLILSAGAYLGLAGKPGTRSVAMES
ncbi:hypothetical protein ACQ0ON_005556, partial [Escherichia coli]